MKQIAVDVAVIGGGPVGMVVANLLGLHDLSVAIFEQEAAPHGTPRASSCDDEAMRVYQLAGLVDELQKTIVACPELEFCDASGERLARIQFEGLDLGNGFNSLNFFHQPTLERVLREGLDRFPKISFQVGHKVTGIEQDATGVDLTVSREDGKTLPVRARYVLGCDGRKSTARKLAGIEYVGKRYERQWLAISAILDEIPPTMPNARFVCDPSRPGFVERGAEGRCRFEFMLQAGDTPESIVTDSSVRQLMAPYVDPAKARIERATVYTFEAKTAARWQVGRLFLLGDAAHAMPPFMGQGLTTGLRDAASLAWKIALAVNGQAGDALLETYERERRPHTDAMIGVTIGLGNIFLFPGHWLAAARRTIFQSLDRIPRFRRLVTNLEFKPVPAYDEGAMLHGRRRKGLLDGAPGNPPAYPEGTIFPQPRVLSAGVERRLDDVLGTGFAVLSVDEDPRAVVRDAALWAGIGARFARVVPAGSAAATGDIVDTTGKLAAWFERYRVSYVVLRPDRFVFGGFASRHADRVEAELRECLAR